MGSRSIEEATERLSAALDALEKAAQPSSSLRQVVKDTAQLVDQLVETLRENLDEEQK